MAVWLVRAGSHGEHEQKFLQDNRVYVTWDNLAENLTKLPNRNELFTKMTQLYPDAKPKRLHNWVSQVWPFAHDIAKGDLIVLPLKSQPAIYVGEISGDYHFEPTGPNPYFHWRPIKWIGESIPRDHFGQDLLNSFGAFMTICRIRRNQAEARIAAMRASGWKTEGIGAIANAGMSPADTAVDDEVQATDLETLGQDQIAKLIAARFRGHGLTRLVDAVLRAQGYTTYVSPPGRDGGVDILAGGGPLGFGSPRLFLLCPVPDGS